MRCAVANSTKRVMLASWRSGSKCLWICPNTPFLKFRRAISVWGDIGPHGDVCLGEGFGRFSVSDLNLCQLCTLIFLTPLFSPFLFSSYSQAGGIGICIIESAFPTPHFSMLESAWAVSSRRLLLEGPFLCNITQPWGCPSEWKDKDWKTRDRDRKRQRAQLCCNSSSLGY